MTDNNVKHSILVAAGVRRYYIDVRQDTKGGDYVTLTEVNYRTDMRRSVIVHPHYIEALIAALQDTLQIVNKS